MKLKILILTVIIPLVTEITSAQADIFNSTPDWVSSPLNHVATGIGVADINQDSWDDIVVANGNDIFRQTVAVYYNNGDGTFPALPSWNSGDIDYHGHLAIGDINGDNLPDVAVSVFLGVGGFNEPGYVKIYFNEGDELESTPSYRTADSMFTFSCALGDADGDGDLDLAVAGGQPYTLGIGPYQTYGRIYYNDGDSLQTLPGWQSQELMGALDVDFADMDGNGFLDVIFANHLTPNYIFLANANGQIQTSASWASQDEDYYANSLTIAKLDSDYLDLIISDNDQLGGQGKYKAYIFNTTPTGKSTPNWFSNTGGYGSAVLAEDVDNDGNVDLLAGRWWGKVQLYHGIEGGFEVQPFWSSSTVSVIEAFALRDVDQDNRFIVKDTVNVALDSIHVIYLSCPNVENIISVELNGQLLSAGIDYCTVPGTYWISTKPALRIEDELIIEYLISHDRDLMVTNWDSDIGNYLFYNLQTSSSIATNKIEKFELSVAAYPNPFNQKCKFQIHVPGATQITLNIFDISGRLVRNIKRMATTPGKYELYWDGKHESGLSIVSGMYLYRLNLDKKFYTGKLLLIR